MLSCRPNTRLIALESSGVARENVVAVPAISAKIAVRSITRPKTPSTRLPSRGAEGFREFLLITAADMDHKAECNREHDIKAPRDRSPVEKRVSGRPFLHAAHHFHLRFIGIQRPLAQRIKQNIRSHGGCKNHSAPLKRAILRLLTVAKLDLAEFGKGYVKRTAYDANAEQCIVEAKVIPQKAAHHAKDELGAFRKNHKQRTYRQYDCQRHQHRYPVKLFFQCVFLHISINPSSI